MADHSHPPTSKKVLVAVGGQGIDAETVRLACRMTDPQGGRLYGVHIIEVNRSLPLGAVLDEVVERGEKILDEVEQLAARDAAAGRDGAGPGPRHGPGARRRGGRVGRRPDRDGPAVQAAVRRVQPGQDGALRAEERELPGDAVPRAPRTPGLTAQGPMPLPGPSLLPAAPSPSLPTWHITLGTSSDRRQPGC